MDCALFCDPRLSWGWGWGVLTSPTPKKMKANFILSATPLAWTKVRIKIISRRLLKQKFEKSKDDKNEITRSGSSKFNISPNSNSIHSNSHPKVSRKECRSSRIYDTMKNDYTRNDVETDVFDT
jgi:hypothetical protein